MAYVIVGLVRGHKYYVQYKDGVWRLNGLINNATHYGTERKAAIEKSKFKDKFGVPLQLMEVLPKTEN